MGSTTLRQLLISLCDDTHWKYSVFWKLKHQTPLILTCEDGYYDDTKAEETWETKSFEGELEGCRIGVVVANMSRFHYAFGEGLVGEVACTGNHMWVSISNFFSREFESKLVPDWTDKWLLQIALGIKTILLVPVFPYGVIQLGSLEEVAENLSAVSLVKDRFNSYRKMTESIAFTSMGNSVFSSSTCKRVKYEKLEDFEGDDSQTRSDHAIGSSSRGNNPETFEFVCPEEELGDLNLEFLEELLNEVNRYTSRDMEIQLFGSDLQLINEGGLKSSADQLYSFSKAGELCKAPATSPQGKTHGLTEESCWVSYKDLADITDPSWLSQRTDSDYVSAAVTTNVFRGSSEDPSSSPSRSYNSPRQSSTAQPQVQSKEVPYIENLLAPCSIAGPSVFDKIESSASFNAMESTLKNKGLNEKSSNHTTKKLSSLKTTRAKNGKTHRLRPRDRQLIQDRVKELRELIPNGSKCSIDGLLDRTIKHMLYLSTAASQAQKLKGLAYPVLYGSINRNSIQFNGTSWGFDCGIESPGCPIVVEDLELPGHMLIKVLCDDHGVFLEIAQLIRRLDLTILNGFLENRSNRSWADFVVEATKGFHRMEIFWPILHLLQRMRSRTQS